MPSMVKHTMFSNWNGCQFTNLGCVITSCLDRYQMAQRSKYNSFFRKIESINTTRQRRDHYFGNVSPTNKIKQQLCVHWRLYNLPNCWSRQVPFFYSGMNRYSANSTLKASDDSIINMVI